MDRLVAALSFAAENEADPDRKSKLRQTAPWLGGGRRNVVTQVAIGVVLHQTVL